MKRKFFTFRYVFGHFAKALVLKAKWSEMANFSTEFQSARNLSRTSRQNV